METTSHWNSLNELTTNNLTDQREIEQREGKGVRRGKGVRSFTDRSIRWLESGRLQVHGYERGVGQTGSRS